MLPPCGSSSRPAIQPSPRKGVMKQTDRSDPRTPGRLLLPGLAAIDGVPDYPFIADRPALVGIDKLHRPQRGILEITHIGPCRRDGASQDNGEGGKQGGLGTHGNPSVE